MKMHMVIFTLVFLSLSVLADEKKKELLLADGFEKMSPGDVISEEKAIEGWISRNKSKLYKANITVIDDPKGAAEGRRFLRAVASSEPLDAKSAGYVKIEAGGMQGHMFISLASLGIAPKQIQGKELHYSIKIRGNGYVVFYLYREKSDGGGMGGNPYSPSVKATSDWSEAEWKYLVLPEAEVATYLGAIHFFTYDERGIDLDDFKVFVNDANQ